MKNLINKFSYTLMILLSLLFISCEIDGEPGIDGKDGNANVRTVTLQNSSFKTGLNKFNISIINNEIVNYGAVLVYMKPSGTTTYFALPYTFNTNEVKVYSVKAGEAALWANYNSNTDVDYKFVIIGGNNISASKNTITDILTNLQNNSVDINDYEQVEQFYDLK